MGFFTYLRSADNEAAAEATTLTVSNEDPDYPAENLSELPISKPWRTQDSRVSSQSISVDLDAAEPVDLVSLVNHKPLAVFHSRCQGGLVL